MQTRADSALSAQRLGATVQGAAEISQCIAAIVITEPGSDPFRPAFGCGIYSRIGLPIAQAGPAAASDIVAAVSLWEPRAVLRRVRYTVTNQPADIDETPSVLNFEIVWESRSGDSGGTLNIALGDDPATGAPIRILATDTWQAITTENDTLISLE
jgi:phage baseplate assembly protein W